MFKYNGAGPVVHVPFDRAYDVRWRPSVLSVYPNRGPSPKRGGGEADVVAAVAVKPTVPVVQAYRPPGNEYEKLLVVGVWFFVYSLFDASYKFDHDHS